MDEKGDGNARFVVDGYKEDALFAVSEVKDERKMRAICPRDACLLWSKT